MLPINCKVLSFTVSKTNTGRKYHTVISQPIGTKACFLLQICYPTFRSVICGQCLIRAIEGVLICVGEMSLPEVANVQNLLQSHFILRYYWYRCGPISIHDCDVIVCSQRPESQLKIECKVGQGYLDSNKRVTGLTWPPQSIASDRAIEEIWREGDCLSNAREIPRDM